MNGAWPSVHVSWVGTHCSGRVANHVSKECSRANASVSSRQHDQHRWQPARVARRLRRPVAPLAKLAPGCVRPSETHLHERGGGGVDLGSGGRDDGGGGEASGGELELHRDEVKQRKGS